MHDFEHGFCKSTSCFCMMYEHAVGENSVFSGHQKYLDQMTQTEDKVRYLLTNIKFLRNFGNKDFVFAYWVFCDGLIWNKPITQGMVKTLTDPETIRRVKQKLVEKNKEAYGVFDTITANEKELKQMGIFEYVISS